MEETKKRGQKPGHPPAKGCGRPKGSKDSKPRQLFVRAGNQNQLVEQIRKELTDAVAKNMPELIPRVFKELDSLEGYAYICGLEKIFKQIMPALQSIELNATVKEHRSLLFEHIESLRIKKE